MVNTLDSSVFSAMQTGSPVKTYKKTILGEVYVTVLNPFSGNPEGLILHGDPKKDEERCLVDIWSASEELFFKRMNGTHLKNGTVIEYKRKGEPEKTEGEILNTLSDEQLDELLNSRYLKLINAINKMSSSGVVYRLLGMAEEQEKSEKIISAIRARLSELELSE